MDRRNAQDDRAMCDVATPGPWEECSFGGPDMPEDGYGVTTAENCWEFICSFGVRAGTQDKLNAAFIAIAREALPYWINEAERLRKGIEAALACDLHEGRFIVAKLLEDPSFIPVNHSKSGRESS